MSKVTIDRELLEQVASEFEHDNDRYMLGRELRKVLDAPRQQEGEAISRERVQAEADAFFDWPTTDKSSVTTTSCLIFARCIAGMVAAERDATITELREEISDLHTTMMAAAVEIQEHWQAHCDEEGYGPANLIHRLERGIAAQYGYTAQSLVQIQAERDTLRQQLAERDATIARLEAGIPRIQEQLHQMRQQRDKLAGLLIRARGCIDAMGWDELETEIDAALAKLEGTQCKPGAT